MSSKFRTGNNPFGGATIGSAKGITGAQGLDAAKGLDSATSKLTNEIAARQTIPATNMQVTHTPNVAVTSTIVRRGKTIKAVADHPWKVTGGDTISVKVGTVASALLGIPSGVVSDPGDLSLDDGDTLYLQYTYDGEAYALITGSDIEPVEDDGLDPATPTITNYPLATNEGGQINQHCRNNLAVTTICYDGKPVKYFLAI